jgi:hypothetical protein
MSSKTLKIGCFLHQYYLNFLSWILDKIKQIFSVQILGSVGSVDI